MEKHAFKHLDTEDIEKGLMQGLANAGWGRDEITSCLFNAEKLRLLQSNHSRQKLHSLAVLYMT